MGKKKDFVHLHVHSDSSQLDGCGKITDYVKKAKQLGHKALALTEHGTMRSYYNQQIECGEAGIKPLYGIELYMCNDMHRKGLTDEEKQEVAGKLTGGARKKAIKHYEDEQDIRRRWHLTVWAKNKKGLENLFRLSSKAWLDGFYYKPRVDMDALIEHKEGLAVATGCVGSIVHEHACCGQLKRAYAESDRLSNEFGEDLWLEVMPHDLEEQECSNRFAMDLHTRYEGKSRFLATQDAHYVDHSDWHAHEVMLCIGTNDFMDNEDRFRFGNGELYLKSREEMFKGFKSRHGYMGTKNIKASLDNTLVFNETIEDDIIKIDRFKCLMPPIDVPSQYKDEFAYTRALCIHGWEWREIPSRAERYAKRHGLPYEQVMTVYKARLKKELLALHKQKFIGYMLLVRDVYQWTRKNDIMGGPGRGSAAGSMVAFLLGITSVDPIEHGLLFERFINPNRVDPPDIDMDFEDTRRQEIIEFLRQKYGEDKSSQIATVGKLAGKQCLKDVSRVLRVPYAEVNAITNSVVERSSGDERASQTIEDSFKDFEVCRSFDKKYPDVLKHAKVLEGMGKNLGIHAAGVVTSPVELSSIIPLEIRKSDGRDIVVTAVDMYGAQAMGLLKLDVLGLRTLTVLKDACRAIKERHGVDIDLEKLELNDPKTLQGFTDHEYVGIFQYDSPGADQICKGVKFESFEDVAAMTALNRPGTARSGLATQYVARKKNPKLRSEHPIHESVTEVCSDTLGIIVYQEHVQRIFTDIAGFAPGTADSLRKKIAKKFGDEAIGKERANFIAGAKKKIGMDEKTAAKIMDAITFFGSYGFNKSHATAYGIISYWGMWLKTYYPLEFYYALLKSEPTRQRIQNFAKAAKQREIELLPPDVSVSKAQFAIDDEHNAIRGSLVDIKGVGDAACQTIVENQPYESFVDFVQRVNKRKAHKGVIVALAKSGALDSLLPNIKAFVDNAEEWWKKANGKGGAEYLEDKLEWSKTQPDYAAEERQLLASSVSPLAFGKHPIDAYAEFIEKHVPIETCMMSDEDFWDNNHDKAVYLPGVIVEVKYNQIGDFHTGAVPSERDRKLQFWGARYANVNVEDAGGTQNRVKFDIDIFNEHRELIDAGVGTPVIVHCVPNKKFENLRAHFAVDLEMYRKKVESGEELNVWEQIVAGKHPALQRVWKPTKKMDVESVIRQRVSNANFFKGKTAKFTGVVMQVRLKYDKNDNLMAFFSMIDARHNSIDCICFSSAWDKNVAKVIKAGNFLSIELDRQKDSRNKSKWQYFFSGGRIHKYS